MTGAEVLAEIVRQMRTLYEDPGVIAFSSIVMGRDDFWALQTLMEDTGAIPVMRRRVFTHGASFHGVAQVVYDQSEQPHIVVIPVRRLDL